MRKLRRSVSCGCSRIRLKSKKILFIPVIILFLLVSGCTGINTPKAKEFNIPIINIKKNGDFSRGKRVSLNDYKGKPLYLNFWAPWCPPCREEAPTLEKAYRYYKKDGLEFLAIAIKDTDRNVAFFMSDKKLTFPVGLDPDAVVATQYGVSGIPTSFFITREGNVKRMFIGALSETQLQQFIEEII